MALRDHPIEQKIFWLILPICLIPSLVFLGVTIAGSRLTFERAMGSQLHQRANEFAESFDRFTIERMNALDQMGGGRLNPKVLTSAAWDLSGVAYIAVCEPGLDPVFYVAPGGKPLTREALAMREAYFSDWQARHEFIPREGLLTELITPIGGSVEPLRLATFLFAGPNGRVVFYMQPIEAMIQDFRATSGQVPDFFLIFSNASGLIYQSEPVEEVVAERMTRELQSLEPGRRWLTVMMNPQDFQVSPRSLFLFSTRHSYLISPSASTGMKAIERRQSGAATWQFVLRYDLAHFLGPLDTLKWLTVIISLGLVLGMLVLASIAARALVGPLQHLRHQADQLSQGNLDVRASVISRDEIGDLALAFNQMASRLRDTHRDLERRIEENRLHAEHINMINQITRAIIQTRTFDSIFTMLKTELPRLLDFDGLWIGLLDNERRELRVQHIYPHRLISLFERGHLSLRHSLHGRALDVGEPIHVELGPSQAEDLYETRLMRAEGFQSYLIAPLPGRGGMIGCISMVSTTPEAFNREHTELVGSLAGAVAVAIEQAELFQHISQFATELEYRVSERTQELEQANQKLIQTEKYFAMGRLAGNLAHEINNPLGIIKNYLQLVRNQILQAGGGRRRSDPNLGHLDTIDEEVDRIARLVKHLLDLHRPHEQKVRPIDINQEIEQILSLLEESLNKNGVRVIRELSAELPEFVAAPDLVRQVLINLIRNAQDAMEEGGELIIRTSVVSEWVGDRQQETLRIRVTDTGCGISEENLGKVFDPFFTTKAQDKGTGLGLCVSYSIVQVYRGSIDITSEPGRGTTVIVSLPIPPEDDEEDAEPGHETRAESASRQRSLG